MVTTRRSFTTGLAAALALRRSSLGDESAGAKQVNLIRVPNGGIQPQVAVDASGAVHLIYYTGDHLAGNVFYVRSTDGTTSFSPPIRVNSQAASAVAAGTIRGAKLSLGKGGQVHVAWNGSSKALPKGPLNPEQSSDNIYNGLPMLYSRLNQHRTAFEPQRNLMRHTFALDGGGSVAADDSDNVYVAWHGKTKGAAEDEAGRAVWLAISRDGGKMFAPEIPVWSKSTGACACCDLRVFADNKHRVYILYRSATGIVHRDIYLLTSDDDGKSFRGKTVGNWNIGACPASSMDFTAGTRGVVGAWEAEEQVYYATLQPGTLKVSQAIAPPGKQKRRRYPLVATNAAGDTILVWTEGSGWAKGGDLLWQVFDEAGKPKGEPGHIQGVPAWSFGSVFSGPKQGFTILY